MQGEHGLDEGDHVVVPGGVGEVDRVLIFSERLFWPLLAGIGMDGGAYRLFNSHQASSEAIYLTF